MKREAGYTALELAFVCAAAVAVVVPVGLTVVGQDAQGVAQNEMARITERAGPLCEVALAGIVSLDPDELETVVETALTLVINRVEVCDAAALTSAELNVCKKRAKRFRRDIIRTESSRNKIPSYIGTGGIPCDPNLFACP
jgi:hypothetical protein